jgi:hypothetical protein
MNNSPSKVVGTCRLCRAQSIELQDSHIVPRWAYKRLHADRGNPTPVMLGGGIAIQRPKQYSEYLLCRPCEERFGDNENSVSRVLCQADGHAPYKDLVGDVVASDSATPLRAALPGRLNLQELLYFAASVIWRASVSTVIENCNLGPRYNDEFRHYLLGSGAFPCNAACVLTLHDRPLASGFELGRFFSIPSSERHVGYHAHQLVIFGARFNLLVGGILPGFARLCIARAVEPMVILAPHDALFDQLGPWLEAQKPKGAIARPR